MSEKTVSAEPIEHHRTCPEGMDASKPMNETCWAMLDKGPCWHSGTSLWETEFWIPLLDSLEAVMNYLEIEYRKHSSFKRTDI